MPTPHHDPARRARLARTTGAPSPHVVVAFACLLALGLAPAVHANSVRHQMVVNGATIIDESRNSSGSMAFGQTRSSNDYQGRLDGRTYGNGDVGALGSIVGTVSAKTQVTAKASASYRLGRPTGANVAGGKVVLQAVLSGEVVNTATLNLKLEIDVYSDSGTATGSDSRSVAEQPGREQVEFGVAVALPAAIGAGEDILVEPELTLDAIASVTPVNGIVRTATADALNAGGHVAGFRVFNAAGAQVTGFTLSGSGGRSIPELAPPPAGKALAIEYFHAEFAHYFITINADEIAKLDAGIIRGWQRTGQSFNVYTTGGAGLVAVCRFFSASFAPKSSHFDAPRGLGCEAVLTNPAWTFEGDVFFTALPDAGGGCPAGNVPVYRLYNNGQGEAPNHRFTTSEAIQLDMIRDGYVAEGTGTGVGMCSPQ